MPALGSGVRSILEEPVNRSAPAHLRLASVAAALLVATALGAGAPPAAARTGPRVLRVGTYHGITGQYSTIQSAVNAAHPGDWILIGPGDYHERGSMNPEL